MTMKPRLPRIPPSGKLALVYLGASVIWILLGDTIAVQLSGGDNDMLESIQSIKGIIFVVLSSLLIFFLGNRFNRDLKISFQRSERLERKFNALNDAAREGVIDYDFHTDSALVNEKMKFFFPTEDQGINNFWMAYQSHIHPEDAGRVSHEYRMMLISNRTSLQTEFRLLGSDNKYYNVIFSSYLISHISGKPIRLIGAVQDVSELRNLQQEYYEQQLKFKRTMTRTIIKAQEKERTRWAGELHDNVCQLLSVARMYLMDMIKFPEHREHLLGETSQLVADSISEIRQLSASIQSPVFSRTSLAQSVQALVANIHRVNNFEFEWKDGGFDERRLDQEQKLMVYRIIQEQLNNITKYASASRVTVSLSQKEDRVDLEISDNGKGFDTSEVKTGIGLKNMQSRLLAYNGRLEVISSKGNGCRLKAQFACHHEKKEEMAEAV